MANGKEAEQTMRTEAPEQIDELPEDVAAAWTTVPLDLWERLQAQVDSGTKVGPKAPITTVMEDEVNGE